MLGLDTKAQYNSCDPDMVEKSKIKSMLHWAVDAGMQTGNYMAKDNASQEKM